MSHRILVVEDEEHIRDPLVILLGSAGYVVDCRSDGPTGLEAAINGQWSIVILDIRLPGVDGLQVFERMRAAGVDTPVIFLSAFSQFAVRGLNLGAADFVRKPYDGEELLARVRIRIDESIARLGAARGGTTQTGQLLQLGSIAVDLNSRQVFRSGVPVSLTKKEFDLLAFLVQHRDRSLSRAELRKAVWESTHITLNETLSTHIHRLREALEEDPSNPRHIVTQRGEGYIFFSMPRNSARE